MFFIHFVKTLIFSFLPDSIFPILLLLESKKISDPSGDFTQKASRKEKKYGEPHVFQGVSFFVSQVYENCEILSMLQEIFERVLRVLIMF